ncbi:MAG: AI-2E family transporter [Coriobacteriia bacterium]
MKQRALQVALVSWAAIGVLLLAAAAWWLLGQMSGALTPFLLAGIIILALRTPIDRLEAQGVPRSLSVVIWYVFGLTVIGVFLAVIAPIVAEQILDLINDFPSYYEPVATFWLDMQGRAQGVALPEWVRAGFDSVGLSMLSQVASWGRALGNGLVSFGGAAAGFVFNLVLAMVIGFWALKDMPKMRDEIMQLIGERRRGEAEMIMSTVFHVLAGYIRGQMLVSTVTGVLAVVGLSILGVPYAIALGVITGVFNVVPYVGPFIGGVLAAIVGLFVSPWVGLGAILVVVAAQQITDLFVTPRVMSEQVDLHPVLVIFSLLVGGSLFGFWGLILGIPVAAVLKGLFVYYYEKHTDTSLTSEDGALFKITKSDDEADECEPDAVDADSAEETT